MKKIVLIISIFLFFLFITNNVLADTISTNITGEVEKIKNTDSTPFFGANLGDYITRFLKIGMIIGALACLMFLVLGGIAWVTSSGDKQKVEDARNKITSSIIGLAVLASIFVIWQLTLVFLGLDKSDLLRIDSSGGSGVVSKNKSRECQVCMENCTSNCGYVCAPYCSEDYIEP